MHIPFLILSFILGFGVGAFAIYKQKRKVPKTVNPITPPAPPQPTESELSQKVRTDLMEKKILYEEQLSLIFKMGQQMFSNLSIENIAKVMCEDANKIINAEICTFLLEDKSTGYFAPVYSQGVKSEFVDRMRFKRGESISGWVALNNEILVRDNIEDDSWFRQQNKGEYFVNSLLSIPLSIKGEVIGVLNLSNKKPGQPFTDEEIAFLKGLTCEASIALQNVGLYEQLQENYLRTITALAFALDARDSYTREHSENVTKYAVAIAKEMNLRAFDIEHIRRAGLLHDIGKIGIRDGVLLKPTKLTAEEYGDIKSHPAKGEAIVSALPFLKEEARLIRHHHERYDGRGYPDGISGEGIEKGARILAVADSFDAMVENRVYRQALGLNATCEELKKNRDKQFDPEVVDALLRVLEKNPGFLTPTRRSTVEREKNNH